jgi:hypothetical protein
MCDPGFVNVAGDDTYRMTAAKATRNLRATECLFSAQSGHGLLHCMSANGKNGRLLLNFLSAALRIFP